MARQKTSFLRAPQANGTSLLPSGELPGAGIVIDDEEALLAAGKTIRAAVADHPELAGLLFVNPVMVLIDLGFELSPGMQRHISRRLGAGGEVYAELEALDAKLREALKASRKVSFTNPKHVARIVFEELELRPRATAGVEAPKRPLSQVVKYSGDPGPLVREPKVRTRKPVSPAAKRYTRRELTRRGTRISFGLYQPQVSFIDLEAELPELEFVDEAPAELPLEELVFYRDDHPLIVELCRYQILHRRRIAFATPQQYRHIRDGETGSMWRTWISGANFPRRRE